MQEFLLENVYVVLTCFCTYLNHMYLSFSPSLALSL
uniref:Uncharacterized protein n=1 Tax=Anguilla anguilla TaxID=7936 RepID=A0A0E9ST66_ANGAN